MAVPVASDWWKGERDLSRLDLERQVYISLSLYIYIYVYLSLSIYIYYVYIYIYTYGHYILFLPSGLGVLGYSSKGGAVGVGCSGWGWYYILN